MKALGYILITVGFLAGAYYTTVHETEVPRMPFAIALVVGVIGVVLARWATKQHAQHEDRLTTNMGVLEESLARLVERGRQLEADKATVNVYDYRRRIDDEFRADLANFAAARESIAHTHGLQAYADVMNHFAAAERYLNRVWSASTDGYVDEAQIFIGKASSQLDDTLETFRSLGTNEA